MEDKVWPRNRAHCPHPPPRAQMGLHVFFGCYHNLFRLMAKCGVLENLLLKDHTHTFCNNDGDVRELDFRFNVGDTKIGAPFHGACQPCVAPEGGALMPARAACGPAQEWNTSGPLLLGLACTHGPPPPPSGAPYSCCCCCSR